MSHLAFDRHYRVPRTARGLCGRIYYQTVDLRWVTCVECQHLIMVHHPNKKPSDLFRSPAP